MGMHAGLEATEQQVGHSSRGEPGSVTSSAVRHEVQDSLGELERLIEQQHRQVCQSLSVLFPWTQHAV